MMTDSRIIFLNDDNFSKNVEDCVEKLFLVDFWAEWCNPCKMIAPIFEEMSIEYYDKIKFAQLNIDKNPLIVKKYNIRSIPTFLLFKNGVLLASKIGLLSKKQFQEFLNMHNL